jgi:hypothetical protein
MERVYYLDESANSGDVARPGNRLDFGGQPIFTLACIGVEDEARLEDETKRLKARHKVQAPELKSTALREKPAFVADLAEYLRQNRMPGLHRGRRETVLLLRASGGATDSTCGRQR